MLNLLAEGEDVTFQTFADDKAATEDEKRGLARILHGSLDARLKELHALNERGAGVFFMVNQGDGLGRSAGNVKAVRALFVDLDGAPLAPVLAAGVESHAIIESSPGRWHAYWLVKDCPLDQFGPTQKAIAAKFNGDASVCDLPRVMRLPGFKHQKREPFVTRIDALSPMLPYSLEQVRSGLQLAPATASAGVPLPAPETALSDREVAHIRAALSCIDGEKRDAYKSWLEIGMCLKASGGGQRALDLWIEWSRQSVHFDEAECRKKWASFMPKDGGLTIGTLFHRAKEGGFDRAKLVAAEVNAKIDAYTGTDAELDEIRELMATGGLGDATFDKCLSRMKKEHSVPVGTMRAGIQAARKAEKEPPKDHRALARDVLDEIGVGSILRVDRNYFAWSGQVWKPFDAETIVDRVSGNMEDQGLEVRHPVALGVAGQLRGMVLNEPGAFSGARSQWLCSFVNGTVEYVGAGKWKLRPHAREDRLLTFSPVPYGQPTATPVWEQHERERFEGDADADAKNLFLREYMGYSLMMRNDFAKYVLMLGQGRNGKGTMQEVVRMMLGAGNSAFLNLSDFENRFTAAQLLGRFAVIIKEIAVGERFPDAELKKLTAKDSYAKAELKGKDGVPFRSHAKFWMAGNTLPMASDFSIAMRHRAVVLEFNQSFIGREDTSIDEKLGAELPGILHLALDAFGAAIERGGFTIPESSKAAVEQWIGGADPVAQFAKECCEAAPFGGCESTAALYQRFRGWWDDAGMQGRRPERRALTERLKRIVGGEITRAGDANTSMLRGIRLRGGADFGRLAA